MYRSANLNAALGRQAGRQTHHLGAVSLADKIPQRAWVGVLTNVYMPAEDGIQRARQHGRIDGRV